MGVPLLELGGNYISRAAKELGLQDKLIPHQASDPERAATAEFIGSQQEFNTLCLKADSLFRQEREGPPYPWVIADA